ncbi:MAG: transglycosylase SLT domain-containing protein [Pyrinomonadaceae bacterium]
MRELACIFLILLFASTMLSQTADELHTTIRTAVDRKAYQEAMNGLQSFEKKYPELFTLNNYEYLVGRLSEIAGDAAAAMARYHAVVKRNSAFKEYALFHLANISRSSGNLFLERTYLQELTAFSPGSLLADAAEIRIAKSWFESKNYDLAARAMEAIFAKAPAIKTSPGKRETENVVGRGNRLLLAESYLRTGNMVAAREHFTKLLAALINPAQPDDFALAAAKGLDTLDVEPGKLGKSAPMLTDYEHLRRASIYQFNRDFADARLHYSAIVSNHPASGIVPDAIYQTGRGYVQTANFSEAIIWFERTLQQFPDHAVAKDALLQLASAYSRVGKFKEGVKRYREFIDKYPDDERLDRAYLNIIDILRDEGEEIEAQKWAAKVQEVFRGKVPEALALFAETRIHVARSDWAAALSRLDKLLTMQDLGGAAVPGATNRAEITFLRGFVLEQMQRYGEAIDTFLSIPDGRGEYYGGRSTERLLLLSKKPGASPFINEKLNTLTGAQPPKDLDLQRKNIQAALRLSDDGQKREPLLESLRKTYSAIPAYKKIPSFKLIEAGRTQIRKQAQAAEGQDPHKTLADELLFLGLFDEAAPEFDASRNIGNPGDDLRYTLAVYYMRGDMAYRTVAFAEPLWRNVPADYQIDLIPQEDLQLLFPAPYVQLFSKFAVPRNIDPRFLLSLVRQESRYQPNIKSYAAARGLMQFISTTSEKIAGELGRSGFEQDDLYNPATAIQFGSQYTANLFKLFPNQPQAVAASYNGGEDNMKRWMNRSKSNIADLYVPEIAFSQSKDYVYRVMANYRIYQMLYDEKLGPKAGN